MIKWLVYLTVNRAVCPLTLPTSGLSFQCFYLRKQVEKQMEELDRIKQHVQHHAHLQRNSPVDSKGRTDGSNAEAQSGKRLIQRVLSAAKIASESSERCQGRHAKHPICEQRKSFLKPECAGKLVQDDVPEVYVDSDVDGVCYICGPRQNALNNGSCNAERCNTTLWADRRIFGVW